MTQGDALGHVVPPLRGENNGRPSPPDRDVVPPALPPPEQPRELAIDLAGRPGADVLPLRVGKIPRQRRLAAVLEARRQEEAAARRLLPRRPGLRLGPLVEEGRQPLQEPVVAE